MDEYDIPELLFGAGNVEAIDGVGMSGFDNIGDFADIFPTAEDIAQAYASPSYGQDTLSAMGVANDTAPGIGSYLQGAASGLGSLLRQLQGKGTGPGGSQGFDWLRLLLPALLASRAYKEAKGTKVEKGGGTTMAPTPARDTGRYLTTGPTGQPIFAYKYAQGGAVRPFPMQDGGFVFTGDAVEGAGGIQALQQMLPDAQPIRGPGTKTSDSIPAYIEGRNKVTPALVSNGEAYVPPGYDTKGLYALMKTLERNA